MRMGALSGMSVCLSTSGSDQVRAGASGVPPPPPCPLLRRPTQRHGRASEALLAPGPQLQAELSRSAVGSPREAADERSVPSTTSFGGLRDHPETEAGTGDLCVWF